MKIEDVPQDLKYFKGTIIRDITYAVDNEGNYCGVVSDGWDARQDALEMVLDDVDMQCQEILERVKQGKSSPLEYHAAKNLMPLDLLATYMGFSKRKVHKHCKPKNFEKLDKETLEAYANALRITVEQLVTIPK